MLTYLVALLMAFTVSIVLTPLLRDSAIRRGLVDVPVDARKVHVVPTPRVGGIAIVAGFLFPVVGLLFWDNRVSVAVVSDQLQFAGLVAGSLIAVAVGLYDDLYGIRPVPKLGLQSVAALVAIATGYQIVAIANPFGDPIVLGIMGPLVTWLWIVGMMNAINLIDGLDGLAGGVSLIAVCTLFALGVVTDKPIVALVSIALAGALLGFLRHNFNPATIFMGDSGSLFLGYVLATTGIAGSTKSSTLVALLIPIVALGVPLMDTSLTLVRRFIAGTPLFGADRAHIHHRLLDLGFTHRQTVLVLYGSSLGMAIAALLLISASREQTAVVLGVTLIGLTAFARMLGYLNVDSVTNAWRYGRQRRNSLPNYLARLRAAGDAIRSSRSLDELEVAVRELSSLLATDGGEVVLKVTGASVSLDHHTTWPSSALNRTGFVISLPFDATTSEVQVSGHLDLVWHCEEGLLRIPERPIYEWLAWLVRDQALLLGQQRSVSATELDRHHAG